VGTRKLDARKRRHVRVRKKIAGSTEKPRLNVFRSTRHIYAQVIDDLSGRTVTSASTLESELKGKLKSGGNREAAKSVGTLLARRASDKGISRVVFDRGGYGFHGRIKALADAAREGGLKF
jgi:large subunit ribosomal protein L18